MCIRNTGRNIYWKRPTFLHFKFLTPYFPRLSLLVCLSSFPLSLSFFSFCLLVKSDYYETGVYFWLETDIYPPPPSEIDIFFQNKTALFHAPLLTTTNINRSFLRKKDVKMLPYSIFSSSGIVYLYSSESQYRLQCITP
jgi:hypothetical protein